VRTREDAAPPTRAEIARAGERIRAGLLVAFPTETVYGLGADATNPRAVARVFAAKGRPRNNPLIVHVATLAQALEVAAVWPREARALARAFWPGPLTMVLPKARTIAPAACAGQASVGVRMPRHALALALIRSAQRPLVGPSANVSGNVSPTTAAHVRSEFAEGKVLVLDGGPCSVGIESTVVSLLGVVAGTGAARVLRPGVISQAQIDAVLRQDAQRAGARAGKGALAERESKRESERASESERKSKGKASNDAPLSPGMLHKHYAPAVPLVVAMDVSRANALLRGKGPPSLVIAQEASSRFALRTGDGFLRMPKDATRYAAKLYAALHETLWFARIVLVAPPRAGGEARAKARSKDGAVWEAVWDRIDRASAQEA
jgi:L-threonylcarbamoyladenylate synthase